MIKFNMIRSRKQTMPSQLLKVQKNLQKQITEGINSSPFNETQALDIKIYDRPISRLLFTYFEVADNCIPLKMKASFTRAGYEKGKMGAKRYEFAENFSLEELNDLKQGKDLVNKKGTFLNRLVSNINKAIGE